MKQLLKALQRLQEVSSLATLEILKSMKLCTTADLLKIMPAIRNSSYTSFHDSGTRKLASGDNYLLIIKQNHLFLQQQAYFHTVPRRCFNNNKHKQPTTTTFSMSSLAAEPLAAASSKTTTAPAASCENSKITPISNGCCSKNTNDETIAPSDSSSEKSCSQAGLPDILKFMELIGNLKHTKRTGWVLRDVNDCESISGHMYRMSMMTFLLDGSEGLNQIRCMELALVHDLAESLVGDITPFCGVSKGDKRAMEFKAMEDICKMIEPRGKRIMELFEEYENGESAESQFVKDLDRLDMVMQAFEYEKRDDCLLKHQEFFDSTRGKFKHPFVKKLVEEIYVQRDQLARSKGATPPPPVHVPNMGDNNIAKNYDATTNLEKNLTPS